MNRLKPVHEEMSSARSRLKVALVYFAVAAAVGVVIAFVPDRLGWRLLFAAAFTFALALPRWAVVTGFGVVLPSLLSVLVIEAFPTPVTAGIALALRVSWCVTALLTGRLVFRLATVVRDLGLPERRAQALLRLAALVLVGVVTWWAIRESFLATNTYVAWLLVLLVVAVASLIVPDCWFEIAAAGSLGVLFRAFIGDSNLLPVDVGAAVAWAAPLVAVAFLAWASRLLLPRLFGQRPSIGDV
jgi:hypothetical protein